MNSKTKVIITLMAKFENEIKKYLAKSMILGALTNMFKRKGILPAEYTLDASKNFNSTSLARVLASCSSRLLSQVSQVILSHPETTNIGTIRQL